jgi:hypothetical protein
MVFRYLSIQFVAQIDNAGTIKGLVLRNVLCAMMCNVGVFCAAYAHI